MLSGCPDCGGNKFQFKPKGRDDADKPRSGDASNGTPESTTGTAKSTTETSESTTGTPESTTSTPESTTSTPESATSTGNGGLSGGPTGRYSAETPDRPSAPDGASEPSEPSEPTDSTSGTERVGETDHEDTAQASARSDVVSPDELDRASRPVTADDADESEEPPDHRPDIDELRDELNEQFESIRIVSPGKYELNLMELYDRQEYIISLQEDGRYVIEMPDAWSVSDE